MNYTFPFGDPEFTLSQEEIEDLIDNAFAPVRRPEKAKKCTCGSESVGGPGHSDYCDLVEELKESR